MALQLESEVANRIEQHLDDYLSVPREINQSNAEAIRQIRCLERVEALPIIALTALAMGGDREWCITTGATDYFSKPFKLKQLEQRIQQLLACQSH